MFSRFRFRFWFRCLSATLTVRLKQTVKCDGQVSQRCICPIMTAVCEVCHLYLFVFQVSDPQRPLSMGVTLSELSLQVTHTRLDLGGASPSKTDSYLKPKNPLLSP